MSGIQEVISQHLPHHYTWDYKASGLNVAVCDCGEQSQGTQEPSILTVAHIAQVLLAVGYRKPRTITTVEELDALAVDSVVIDAVGDVARKMGRDEWLCNGRISTQSNYWLQTPATVLYEPAP